MTRTGGERPFRSVRPFAAWQDRPVGHDLTRAASVGVRRSPVSRLFQGGVGRSLIAYSSPTPHCSADGTGLGAIRDHAAHRVAPIETAVRRRSGRGDARAGGPCRTTAPSDARETRRHANRLRRSPCRAGHELRGRRSANPIDDQSAHRAAANPSRRGPRQRGCWRRFSPRGGGPAGRNGPPARALFATLSCKRHESSGRRRLLLDRPADDGPENAVGLGEDV